MSEAKLPYELAIRTVLNDVSYSNPVPDWYTPAEIDYGARERRLRERVAAYLNGRKPTAAMPIMVPHAGSEKRRWVVPAVNDQMILQACVSNLAPAIGRQFQKVRVFSGEPNDDPNRIELMKNQVVAWLAFQRATIDRLEHDHWILQFDIQRAYASSSRPDFMRFIRTLAPAGPEADLIGMMLEAWSETHPGIPMVNDSVFFLGSAYFNAVDRVVARTSANFIRFVDDYRVFGRSEAELDRALQQISMDLSSMGFRLNPAKVKLGSRPDYLEAISDARFAPAVRSEYVVDVDPGINRQLEPEQVAKLVSRTLARPGEYLNDGIGRRLLGALRRYRFNAVLSRRAHNASSPAAELRRLLLGDPQVLSRAQTLLGSYGKDPAEAWRTVWLIYFAEQTSVTATTRADLAALEGDLRLPVVVRLWAKRCRLGKGGEPPRLDEDLHDLGYIAAGLRCYGESLCTGEGF